MSTPRAATVPAARRRYLFAAALTFALLVPFGGALRAEPVWVDVALVLAVDASASVDAAEGAAQREGYAAALRHPELARAIRAGRHGRIAVTYFEWARGVLSPTVVPWRVVGSAEDAAALAEAIERLPAASLPGTSLSAAIEGGLAMLATMPVSADRQVINVSGDGPNNAGAPVLPARDRAVARGVTINGLPVMIRPSPAAPALDRYFAGCVAGGEGSFVLAVREASELAPAIRRKLILEVSGATPLVRRVAAAAPVDCLVGERFRARWADRFFPELGP